jgi:KDO2-lipid IV(A) lauroyltransferase
MDNRARIGYRAIFLLARFLPRRVSYLIGETLGASFFLLSPARRQVLRRNLAIALGLDRAAPWRTGCKVMVNLGRNIAEIFMLAHMTGPELTGKVEVTGRARLDAALERGRGAILATAHLGSWEVGGAALAAMGYRITTVAGIQLNPSLSPYLRQLKRDLNIDVVSSGMESRRLITALRHNEVVALHLDGDQFAGGTAVEYFGGKVRLAGGPAALGLRTGAALLPAFAVRINRWRIRVMIEEEVETAGRDEIAITQQIVNLVERYVRRYPEQWCMFRPLAEPEP